MKILFATGRPFFPELFGGAERSIRELLVTMQCRGHQCEGIAVQSKGVRATVNSIVRKMTMNRMVMSQDRLAGFPVYRTREWLLETAVKRRLKGMQPDFAITQLSYAGEIAEWSLACSVKPFVFVRDTEWVPFEHSHAQNPAIGFISNSRFTASWLAEKYLRHSHVVYPPIDISRFRVSSDPKYVTFINPVPVKGVELALSIADQLPNVPFLFVESWPLDDKQNKDLQQMLARRPNITLWPRRPDIQEVYNQSKLLIVPSMWEEAFGRVVIEAQACGVPVIGRDIGGIPEAVGHGGTVLPQAFGAEEWAAEISRILNNREEYESLRSAATVNASQGPWNPERVADAFESLLLEDSPPMNEDSASGSPHATDLKS